MLLSIIRPLRRTQGATGKEKTMGESEDTGQTPAPNDDGQPAPTPDEKAAAATEKAATKTPPPPAYEDTPPVT
jgi:hypothetical protein